MDRRKIRWNGWGWNEAHDELSGRAELWTWLARELGMPTLLPDSTTKPISAMRHVPPSLAAQPVLNAYEFGGYLIFNGLRPFIDGRSDMYGDAFYGRYARIADGDQSAFDAAVRRYGIRWTLLSPASATALKLDQRAGWRRLYGDKWAVVHVRAETPRS